MSEKTKEELQEGDFKVKKKRGRPKKLVSNEEITKVNLTKKEENATEEPSTTPMDVDASTRNGEEVGEGNAEKSTSTPESEKESGIEEPSTPVLEEITPSTKEEEVKEPTETPEVTFEKEPSTPEIVLPEGINKLISFMKDTGGTIEDYARLNTNYNDLNNEQLLREYYKNSKSHLTSDDITVLMEENFAWDDEEDDDREIKLRQIALKEELAKARQFLNETKEQYYEELKLKPNTTIQQKEALDFYNKYNEGQNMVQKRHEVFKKSTRDFFQNKFEGFEFNVGEKAFKYNISNTDDVATKQSDLNNIIGKFLNKNGEVDDYKGYHKAMYAARNPDSLAKHFYEQGKADAIKQVTANSNNITPVGRETPGDITFNGYKVRAISGDESSKLKIKTKQK